MVAGGGLLGAPGRGLGMVPLEQGGELLLKSVVLPLQQQALVWPQPRPAVELGWGVELGWRAEQGCGHRLTR